MASTERKAWNKRQGQLRASLKDPGRHQEAIQLFLDQHAMVHSEKMSQSGLWSFADEILDDMTEEQVRHIPGDSEHSVAWLLWHMARIEDVTMNLLVAGEPQLFNQENWPERLGVTVRNTGNAMDEEWVRQLSAAVDVEALLDYRLAVGRRTREIVGELRPEQLKQKVDPARLQRVLDEGAVVPEAQSLIDYWGRRAIAGLLLMPPTRHNFVHLNEAQRLKGKR
ncbi:MAG: DinB family protein [Chloroflexota bacterium]|nr:MAG: DinB family protein [Chloroflexota bacterium]